MSSTDRSPDLFSPLPRSYADEHSNLEQLGNRGKEQYRKRLDASDEACRIVAAYLYNNHPLVTDARLAEHQRNHIDSGDVFVQLNNQPRWRIVEVKQRPAMTFTCAREYPYNTVIVGCRSSLDRLGNKVWVNFIVNGPLTHAAVIPTSTREHWILSRRNVRTFDGGLQTNYECAKRFCKWITL